MNQEWTNVLNTLSYIDPKYIDKEGIKIKLSYCTNYDMQVLDHLLMMQIITQDEYIGYIGVLIQKYKDKIAHLEEVAHQAAIEEDYNPMKYYCCCRVKE